MKKPGNNSSSAGSGDHEQADPLRAQAPQTKELALSKSLDLSDQNPSNSEQKQAEDQQHDSIERTDTIATILHDHEIALVEEDTLGTQQPIAKSTKKSDPSQNLEIAEDLRPKSQSLLEPD